jgi:hypothetical protein
MFVPIHNCQRFYFGHILPSYLSRTWMFKNPEAKSRFVEKSSGLAPALGVTKFIISKDVILITICRATEVRLMFNKADAGLNKCSCLTAAFMCDQIHNKYFDEVGNTLSCCLSQT